MSFEDLEAWQQARVLVNQVYPLTREQALERDFRLVDQLRGAALSIMNNLAEGFERTHTKEKLQFYKIARGSAGEVRSMTYVIEDNYAAAAAESLVIRQQAIRCGQLISGLIRSVS